MKIRHLLQPEDGESTSSRRRGFRRQGSSGRRVFVVACRNGRRIHSRSFSRMAFNLKKVIKALLFSSSQPLAIKDHQAAFTRFHEQALRPPVPEAPKPADASAP